MTVRRTALMAGWLLALAAAPAPAQTAGNARPPLNVVLLILDDVRWDALGAAGNPTVRTPRIDQLAREGIRFEQARVTTAICMVSRATLLTGQYMSRHGIAEFGRAIAPEPFAQTYLPCSAGPATGPATWASTASAGPGRTTSISCAPTKARIG
jgi:hypothetical protein